MKKLLLIVLIGVLGAFPAFPQKIPSKVRDLLKDMRFIEGGSFTMGNGEQLYAPEKDTVFLTSNMERRVTVAGFWLSAKEVSNDEWKAFYEAKLNELGEEAAAQFLPDTSVWTKNFPYAFNGPLTKYYYSHPTYGDYPVVGITWHQAKAYCEWKSQYINQLLADAGLFPMPNFRLPTEAEWEYAARGILPNSDAETDAQTLFPWEGNSLVDKKNNYQANFGTITDPYGFTSKMFADDGYIFTGPVESYQPNAWGLYQMAGNVSEWVEDVASPVLMLDIIDLNPIRNSSPEGGTSSNSIKTSIRQAMANQDTAQIKQWVKQTYAQKDTSYQQAWIDNLCRDAFVLYRNRLEMRVIKGGSWANAPAYLLCGSRGAMPAQSASSLVGFRLAIINLSDKPKPNSPLGD